jgi:RNA polymerase sigma-70 factor (ECF subfamily)
MQMQMMARREPAARFRRSLWFSEARQMAVAGRVIDHPASLKHNRAGDHLRVVSGQAPQRDDDSDMASGDNDNVRFRNVVLPHLGDAYTLARWITGNRADAEDVVQDACLRAFRAIRNFDGGSRRAWVLTIVRHTAYSWLRKNRPTALVMVENLEAVEEALATPGKLDGTTPEAVLIAKADAARLEAAIAALPTPFRETLVLRDVQGLDYREIAQVTGVPIGTVMSRLARGRGRLIADIRRREP